MTTVMTMVTGKAIAKRANREIPREDLRQRIGQAALSLFKEAGFDAVSVDQIVAKAGVSKGAFFNFFPTKADALIFYFRELDGSVAHLRADLDPRHPWRR
jgi:AcrR family transcriptional regulator